MIILPILLIFLIFNYSGNKTEDREEAKDATDKNNAALVERTALHIFSFLYSFMQSF
jgi:hypothetical protein